MILRRRRSEIVSLNRQILLQIEGTRTSEPSQLNTSDKTNVEIPTPDFELISNPIQIPFTKPSNLIRQNLSTFLTANATMSTNPTMPTRRTSGYFERWTLNRERPTCSNEACSILNCSNWKPIYKHWKNKTQQTEAQVASFPSDTIGKKMDNNPYVCLRPGPRPRPDIEYTLPYSLSVRNDQLP